MNFDFSEFLELEQTADGDFVSGKNGVTKILTPVDRKSEFIFIGASVFVKIYSAIGCLLYTSVNYRRFWPEFIGFLSAVYIVIGNLYGNAKRVVCVYFPSGISVYAERNGRVSNGGRCKCISYLFFYHDAGGIGCYCYDCSVLFCMAVE